MRRFHRNVDFSSTAARLFMDAWVARFCGNSVGFKRLYAFAGGEGASHDTIDFIADGSPVLERLETTRWSGSEARSGITRRRRRRSPATR